MEIAFAPVDNTRLANLCGVLEENLRQIETGLDVVITRRRRALPHYRKNSQDLGLPLN